MGAMAVSREPHTLTARTAGRDRVMAAASRRDGVEYQRRFCIAWGRDQSGAVSKRFDSSGLFPTVLCVVHPRRLNYSVQYFALFGFFIRRPLPALLMKALIGIAMKLAVHCLNPEPRHQAFRLLQKVFHSSQRLLAAGLRKSLRLAGLLTMTLLLTSCSTLKIAYNQSPELAYWYFDAYADFDGAQSLQLKTDLARLHTWHRQTQMPGYVALLQDVQRKILGDINANQTCSIYSDARDKLLAVSARAESSVALLAGSLDARQLQHMERRFAKKNAEYRDDFLEGRPEALRARRLDKVVSRAETLYGRLDGQQTDMLGRMVDQSSFDAARSYAERQRRQRDVLDTFRQLNASAAVHASARPVADKAAKSVHALITRTINSPDAAYRGYAEKLIADNCQSFTDFHNTTSAAQRNHAASTLAKYEKDLKILVGQGGS